jgi:hypothetical protein
MMRNATISAIFLFATTSFATATGDLPVNPDVTPENIDETICVKGYSSSIRPPLDTIGDYILDHRINIAIGGSPTSLHNLQLEDRFESFEKDRAENRAHSLVCTHRLSLREAQAIMYSDWRRLLPAR